MSQHLDPSRLEAFSDGVIAVIMTIMVLELKVPTLTVSNFAGLQSVFPLLMVYLLSFIQVGIYWVNHHYLIDDLEQVTHGILWSNLALLFSLSLIPWATNWVGERGISSFSIALYSVICQLPAYTWIVLAAQIRRRTGKPLTATLPQQISSSLLYLVAVPVAYLSPYLALAMIGVVAVLWTLPPKRVREKTRSTPASK
ncbi:MAG: TMEM175 family protein [Bryocella sp.]